MELSLGYFFGDISSLEAGEKLKEKNIPRSFLLRKNGNDYKLSWLTFDGALKHTHIQQNRGKFSLQTIEKQFASIEKMVKHCQKLDQRNKMSLGTPLIAENSARSSCILSRDTKFLGSDWIPDENAKAKENVAIGRMDTDKAEILLQDKPTGSWLLRQNSQGEYRISFKMDSKAGHVKLTRSPTGDFRLRNSDKFAPLDALLEGIIGQGAQGEQIVSEDNFTQVLAEAEHRLKTGTFLRFDQAKVRREIEKQFAGNKLSSQMFSKLEGTSKQVCLMLLNLMMPDMDERLQQMAHSVLILGGAVQF